MSRLLARILSLTVSLLVTNVPLAVAETITFKMTGTITESQPTFPPGQKFANTCRSFSPAFPVGQQIVFTYTFKSDTSDEDPNLTWGWYESPSTVNVTTGSYVATANQVGISVGKWEIGGVFDYYEVDVPVDPFNFLTGPPVSTDQGSDVLPMYFFTEVLSIQTLSDDSLPIAPPLLDTPYRVWVMHFSNGFCLWGPVTALERVSDPYAFAGFFAPVNNSPTLNVMKAGAAVPVKFSLGGDKGLGILAVGSPSSRPVSCDTAVSSDGVEETLTAGNSSLSYDASTDVYTYVWKTDKSWTGTCRELNVQLLDNSQRKALFKFAK